MRSTTSLSLLVLVLLAAGCSSPDSPARAHVTDEGTAPRIVGGTPSTTAQDATVLIVLRDGFCTGSLIAPNLVLTARHCVSEMAGNDECQHFTTDDTASQMGVVLGKNASPNDTPVAYGTKLFHETNPSGCSYDIALIQLDHDITGATIAQVRGTQATTSDVGVAVGYGDADDNGDLTNGRYQRGSLNVFAVGGSAGASYTYKTKAGKGIPVDVSPGELLTGESTCFGDSGGPLLDASGYVIGVTSRGVDQYCIDRPTVWSDVYSHLTMITNAATSAGHPITPAGSGSSSSSSSSSSSGGSSSSSGGSSSGGSSSGTPTGPSTPSGTSSGGISSSGDDGTPTTTPSTSSGDDTTTTSTSGGCNAAPSSRADGSMIAVALAVLAVTRRRRR